jgi:hypothetical protein
MINLLPDAEKKFIYHEYKLRVVVVALISTLVLCAIALILIFPSYILTIYQGKITKDQISDVYTKDSTEQVHLEKALKEIKKQMAVLSPVETKQSVSDVFTFLVKDRSAGIKIVDMTYSSADKVSYKLTLRGVAPNRQSLLVFSQALKAEKGVTSLDLPVSTFTKDTDINFTLSIQGKLQ